MKHGFLLLLCLAACRQATPSTRTAAPQAAQVKTIDTTPPQPAALQPPPVLTDEAPAPKSTVGQITLDAPPPPTPQDEAENLTKTIPRHQKQPLKTFTQPT